MMLPFLVDAKYCDDLKADDIGSWIHKGKPIRYFAKVLSFEVGSVCDVECTKRNIPKPT